MTGRGAGYCAGYSVPGYMNPYGGRAARAPMAVAGWGLPYGAAPAGGLPVGAGRMPYAPSGYLPPGHGFAGSRFGGRGAARGFGGGSGRARGGAGFGRGGGRGRGRW